VLQPAHDRPVGSTRRTVPALSKIRTLLVCLMWFALATPAAAQGFGPASQSRSGFWISGGLGHAFTDLACNICGGEREGGGWSGYLRAGGTMTPAFLLGGELLAWRKSQNGVGEHLEQIGLAGYWYPKPQHGWFVKLGLGYALYRASEGDEALAARIFSGSLGTGYEMRVNPLWSVVPFLNLTATPSGNLNREDTSDGSYHADRVANDLKVFVIQFGIGITRH
jgi:hypothetical protein